MHDSLQGATFHLEHIIPKVRGGGDEVDNLAWACPSCNLHKSKRVEVVDPETGRIARLFHPRSDRWADHFGWTGLLLVEKTATGRATITALNLNHPRRLRIREAERSFGLFAGESP